MILSQPIRSEARHGASHHASLVGNKAAIVLFEVIVGVVALAAWTTPLRAVTIAIPNGSFESPVVPPVVPYAAPDMDYWQKSPQPGWYNPTNNFNTPWEDLMGTFYNVPSPGTFIDNCDGAQAAFLFAVPDSALFQDYDSIYGTNTTPS